MVDAAFTGYAALPATTSGQGWPDVLGLRDSLVTREVLDERYRELAKMHHLDIGGDPEIWSVNDANAPSTILAGTTIANVPATIAPGPRTITGTFPAPATVVVGLPYALVITGQPNQSFELLGSFNNPCPDGNWFSAATTDGAFAAHPTIDLRFATFVTA